MKHSVFRRIAPSVLLLIVLAGAAPAFAQAPAGWLERLPADTWFLAGYNGRVWSSPEAGATPLGKILAEPQVKRYADEVIRPLWDSLKKASGAGRGGQADPIDALWTLAEVGCAQRVGVALLGVDLDDNGPPRPQAVLSLAPGERKADVVKALGALEEILAAQVGRMRDAAGNPIKIETREIAGNKVKTLRCPVGPAALVVNWGWIADELLITAGDRAEQIVFGATKPAATLYADAGFRAAGKALRGDGRAVAFMLRVNVKAIRTKFDGMMPKEVRAALSAAGLDAIDSFSEGLRIEDGRFRSTTLVQASERRGLLKVFSGPADDGALRLIPQSAKFFGTMPLDLAVLHDVVRDVVLATGGPRAAAGFDRDVGEQLSKTLGMDVRRILLPALGNRITLVGAPDDALPAYGGLTAVIEVKDAAVVRKAMDRIYGMMAEEAAQNMGFRGRGGGLFGFAPVFDRDYGKHRIKGFNVMMAAPCWTVTDKHLIIGVNPQAVIDYLNFLDDPKAATIKDNPDFAAGLKAVGGAGEFVGYADLRALWGLLHSFAIIGVQAGEIALRMEFPAGADRPTLRPELFPSVGSVKPHVTGIVQAGRWEGDTLRIETSGPMPMPTPMIGGAMNVAVLGSMFFFVRSAPAAFPPAAAIAVPAEPRIVAPEPRIAVPLVPAEPKVAEPRIAPPDPKAPEPRSAPARTPGVLGLMQLYKALALHHLDKGRHATELNQLKPYFTADAYDRLLNDPNAGKLEFFGVPADRRRPFAPVAAYPAGRDGLRVVLVGEGSVRLMSPADVQRAVESPGGKKEKE